MYSNFYLVACAYFLVTQQKVVTIQMPFRIDFRKSQFDAATVQMEMQKAASDILSKTFKEIGIKPENISVTPYLMHSEFAYNSKPHAAPGVK